jgi:hypothetical protein
MEEAPQAPQVPHVVHESFMPAFHFPISPFSMSSVETQPNRLRYRKRRG